MKLLALLLAAAPVLEPDPGKLPRVQPREVSGGGEGVLWAVDDDPATAWKARGKDASLTWTGAWRENATAMKVFVRAGCQDSKESFSAWARPRHVTLDEPLRHSTRRRKLFIPGMFEEYDGKDAKESQVVAELKDVPGWQEISVPLDKAMRAAFVLRVKDTYAGASHPEACISDLRVYLDSKDPVDSGEEQLAADGIKRSITETLTRANGAPRRLPAHFDTKDIDTDTPQAQPKGELALESPNAFPALVKRSRQVAAEMRATWKVPVSQLEANGWRRAAVKGVLDDDGALEQSLIGVEGISQLGDTMIATDDFKLVSARNPLAGLRALAGKMEKLETKPLECRALCLPTYAATMTSVVGARGDCERVCGYGKDIVYGMREDLGGSGIFVKGGLDTPREVLLVSSREGGEREMMRRSERELLVYANGRVSATARVSYDAQYVDTQLVSWNEDRSSVAAVTRIMLNGSRVESAQLMTPKPEHASLEQGGDGAIAFRSP
jgi:hypothetical protein